MSQNLQIIFDLDSAERRGVLSAITSLLERHRLSPTHFESEGMKTTSQRMLAHLRNPTSVGFDVRGNYFEFSIGSIRTWDQDYLSIRDSLGERIPWDEWVYALAPVGLFVMAWLVDTEYDYWQNAADPMEYNAAGRSYSHLPMKSNELPPPLLKMVIDNSRNPGRWTLKPGYREAVGARMWLGEPFWRHSGTDKRVVLRAKWLRVEETDSVLAIAAKEQPFRSDVGEERELQNRLRSLLFGESQHCLNSELR